MSLGSRIRDLALEVLLAVVLVCALVAYAIHTAGKPRDLTLLPEIGNTVLVFGFLISWSRNRWRNPAFWIALAVLLLFHLAFYFLVLRPIPRLGTMHYALWSTLELILFVPALNMLLNQQSQ